MLVLRRAAAVTIVNFTNSTATTTAAATGTKRRRRSGPGRHRQVPWIMMLPSSSSSSSLMNLLLLILLLLLLPIQNLFSVQAWTPISCTTYSLRGTNNHENNNNMQQRHIIGMPSLLSVTLTAPHSTRGIIATTTTRMSRSSSRTKRTMAWFLAAGVNNDNNNDKNTGKSAATNNEITKAADMTLSPAPAAQPLMVARTLDRTIRACFLVGIFVFVLLQVPASQSAFATSEAADHDASFCTDSSTATSSSSNNIYNNDRRYWTIMNGSSNSRDDRIIEANTALMDYAVGTVNTMYYDVTGGANFQPRDFYNTWKLWLRDQDQQEAVAAVMVAASEAKDDAGVASSSFLEANGDTRCHSRHHHVLASREGVVQSLKWLMRDGLGDPYSKYLTRDELRAELSTAANEGFLGLGAIVDSPSAETNAFLFGPSQTQSTSSSSSTPLFFPVGSTNPLYSAFSSLSAPFARTPSSHTYKNNNALLTPEQAQRLPVITAVTPDSPAERAGLTVGDRILSVGADSFMMSGRDDSHAKAAVTAKLRTKYNADNYLGHPVLTVAKPVYASYYFYPNPTAANNQGGAVNVAALAEEEAPSFRRDVIRGYRPTRVRLATVAASEPFGAAAVLLATANSGLHDGDQTTKIAGGDAVVHYELLTAQSSIFDRRLVDDGGVGYIRLTRFSRASTQGFLQAVEALEAAGASSYIIDLRNNYGGVIQEAMLTASTLLRDPHVVLCYTMNSRGGFTPHDVEEYVVDKRYPGYLLSRGEARTATLNQVKRESPELFEPDGWSPMSSYASLHEQQVRRGIHRPGSSGSNAGAAAFSPWNFVGLSSSSSDHQSLSAMAHLQQLAAQKNLVLLINEGTASSAEVFASALHDNGRTVALIGSKTYGKGLVQHTFPMPDGGGLRLTVAEYLTPALHHVTHVGGAQFDRVTSEWIGGGIRPDMECDSRGGIPSNNIGADLCVGMALDALEEADSVFQASGQLTVKRIGGVDDGSKVRRAVTQGIVKDDF